MWFLPLDIIKIVVHFILDSFENGTLWSFSLNMRSMYRYDSVNGSKRIPLAFANTLLPMAVLMI